MIALFKRRTTPAAQPAIERTPADDEGVVRIGLPSLIALRHGAESLPLRPGRVLAAGAGNYRSPFKGRGMEFDEVRPYTQGDDARALDWRVTARTGRPHTKLFREERERTVLVWVDLRNPMFFATQGAFKAVRAAQAAALLGWSAVAQGDRIGGLIFSESTHIELRPRRGKSALLHMLSKLADHPNWSQKEHRSSPDQSSEELNQALTRLRRVAQPGSLICLLSDFSGLNEQAVTHLRQLARHSDMVFGATSDPLEAELPPPGYYRVGDGERFLSVMASDKQLRERYHQQFAAQQTTLLQLCKQHGMTWLPLVTVDEPLRALQRGLGVRR